MPQIEFLGWNKHTPDGLEKCNRLIKNTRIFPVNEDVADRAIEIRQEKKIKLPDGVRVHSLVGGPLRFEQLVEP